MIAALLFCTTLLASSVFHVEAVSESVSRNISDITPERAYDLLVQAFIGAGGSVVDGGNPPSFVGLRMSRSLNGYDFTVFVNSARRPDYFYYMMEGDAPARNFRAQVDIDQQGDGVFIRWRNNFDNLPGEDLSLAYLYVQGLDFIESNK